MKYEDLYDGMDITIYDPLTNEKCVGVIKKTDWFFTACYSCSGFKSEAIVKDQSDVEQFKIEVL